MILNATLDHKDLILLGNFRHTGIHSASFVFYVNEEFQGMMRAQNCVPWSKYLPQLPHLIISPVLRVPSVVFLNNVVVKGFSALLSTLLLSELQQETLRHSSTW
jgi:hypothetical protein